MSADFDACFSGGGRAGRTRSFRSAIITRRHNIRRYAIQSDRGGMLEVADQYGINVPSIVRRLGVDGCGEGYLSPEKGWEIINYVSTAAFEETLKCNTTATESLESIASSAQVIMECCGDFREYPLRNLHSQVH